VEAISKGSICIESTVETMARVENEKVAAEAVDIYRAEFQKLVEFPTETMEEMSSAHEMCQKKATEHFLKHYICDYDNSYKQQFLGKVLEAYDRFQSENMHASSKRCTELINLLYGPLTEKDYMQVGGYNMYQKDIELLKIQYDTEKHKGLMAKAKWSDFMTELAAIQMQILNADNNFATAEKAIARENRKRKEAERRILAANEAVKFVEQALRDQERCLRQETERMRQQMEDEKWQRELEYRKGQEARQAEYERLLKEGLAEKARLQAEAINMLREEQAKAARAAEDSRIRFEVMRQRDIEEREREVAKLRQELMDRAEKNEPLAEPLDSKKTLKTKPKHKPCHVS
jgi:chromosome segregation ATPase